MWIAPDGALCRQHQDGACWAFIAQKLGYLGYGSYPEAEHWRVDVVEILGAALIVWLLWPGAPRQATRRLGVLRRLSDRRLRAAGRRAVAGAAACRHAAVGRGVRLAGHRARRHRRFAAARRAAGARAALATAGRAARERDLHRIRARRAVHHRAVHGQQHAAAVPAAGLGAGPVPASAGRHRAVLGRLHGGGGARRPADAGRGPIRRGDGARPRLLAHDAARRAAAGAGAGHPRHRQQFHRPVQGHDAGGDRRRQRFPRTMDNAFKDPVWAGPTLLATGYAFAALFYFVFCYAMSAYSAGVERRLAVGRRR